MSKLIIGNILNYIISFSLIISGLLKLMGVKAYIEMIKALSLNYYEHIHLLGIIAIVSGILFLLPKTFTFGLMFSLLFLGGTISAHMQHGDIILPQVLFAILTITVAYLKRPVWFKAKKTY